MVWPKQQAMGQAWGLDRGTRARFAGQLSLFHLDPVHGTEHSVCVGLCVCGR